MIVIGGRARPPRHPPGGLGERDVGVDRPWIGSPGSGSQEPGCFLGELGHHLRRRGDLGDLADLKNVGDRYGGALFAGLFLQEFVGDRPWAHLDIAGPARAESDDGYLSKGSTGVTVRTLLTWLQRRSTL